MFWKKHYLTDVTLGKFERVLDHWLSVETINEVSLSLQGTKTEFEPTSLQQASLLLESKERIQAEAVSYLTKQNIEHFSKMESLSLSSLASSSVNGTFDVEFEVADWEDAYVIVHFKAGKPESLSMGD